MSWRLVTLSLLFTYCLANAAQAPFELQPVEISLYGGYGYGGINPQHTSWSIDSNGATVLLRESFYTGKTRITGRLPSEQLKELASFIVEKGFFELDSLYDCQKDDAPCLRAKKPSNYSAAPLVVSIRVGARIHRVTATVYEFRIGLAHGEAAYPPALVEIVGRIRWEINSSLRDTVLIQAD